MRANPKTQVAVQKAKAEFVAMIQDHFELEHGVNVGRFEAEELFDRCLKETVPVLYNQALADARDYFLEHFQVLAEDVVQLEISSTKG
jgi:uncharacterized protein (DUF2164 family)